MGKYILGMITVWFFGNAFWITGVIDLAWLLIKNHTLFSWWYVIGSGILAIAGLLFALLSVVND